MFKLFSHFKWKPNHVITTPEIPIISIYLSPFLVAGGLTGGLGIEQHKCQRCTLRTLCGRSVKSVHIQILD